MPDLGIFDSSEKSDQPLSLGAILGTEKKLKIGGRKQQVVKSQAAESDSQDVVTERGRRRRNLTARVSVAGRGFPKQIPGNSPTGRLLRRRAMAVRNSHDGVSSTDARKQDDEPGEARTRKGENGSGDQPVIKRRRLSNDNLTDSNGEKGTAGAEISATVDETETRDASPAPSDRSHGATDTGDGKENTFGPGGVTALRRLRAEKSRGNQHLLSATSVKGSGGESPPVSDSESPAGSCCEAQQPTAPKSLGSIVPERLVGTDGHKLDREHTRFSDANVFHVHEMVIVPRSRERLHYGKIIAINEDRSTLTVMVGYGPSGVPLTKLLPRILVGRLPKLPIKEELPMTRAGGVIRTLESLFKFMKDHPPVTDASFVGAVGARAAAGKVKSDTSPIAPETPTVAGSAEVTSPASHQSLTSPTPAGSTPEAAKNPPLSPALYDHCLFLFAYHARRLFYFCKVLELQTQSALKNGGKNSETMQTDQLKKRVGDLESQVEELERENSKLRGQINASGRSDVGDSEKDQEAEASDSHRQEIRMKNETIRKLQKKIRDSARSSEIKLENLWDRVEKVFQDAFAKVDSPTMVQEE